MDINRVLGKLEEAQRQVERRIYEVTDKIEKMDHKIDSLLSLKWKIFGGIAIMAFLGPLVIELIRH